MQPENLLRPGCDRCNLINIKVGGITRQNRPLTGILIESAENLLLDFHFLKNRFNHHIRVSDPFKIRRGDKSSQDFLLILRPHPAFADMAVINLFHIQTPFFQACFITLDHHHLQACIQCRHCDTTSHRSSPDDREPFQFPRLDFPEFRNLPATPFGEKSMDQPLPLRTFQASGKAFPFIFQSLLKRSGECFFHAVNDLEGRVEPFSFFLPCVSMLPDGHMVFRFVLQSLRPLPSWDSRVFSCSCLQHEIDGRRDQITGFIDPVDHSIR